MTNATLHAEFGSYRDDLTAIRQDIHAHPETGFEVARTAGIVAGKLREWGLEVTERVGTTGVVGTVIHHGLPCRRRDAADRSHRRDRAVTTRRMQDAAAGAAA